MSQWCCICGADGHRWSLMNRNMCFLVFINGRSGGHKGQIALGALSSLVSDDGPLLMLVDMAQFRGKSRDHVIYEELRKRVSSARENARKLGREVRAVVGGGDGTILWLYEIWHWANIEPVPLAVLPLGVGNELSR